MNPDNPNYRKEIELAELSDQAEDLVLDYFDQHYPNLGSRCFGVAEDDIEMRSELFDVLTESAGDALETGEKYYIFFARVRPHP